MGFVGGGHVDFHQLNGLKIGDGNRGPILLLGFDELRVRLF